MFEHDNITGAIGELHFFENIGFVMVSELDNTTGAIGELDYFDNIEFV
jgi:hypothetical protein